MLSDEAYVVFKNYFKSGTCSNFLENPRADSFLKNILSFKFSLINLFSTS